MSIADLQRTVEAAWDDRDRIGPATRGAAREAIDSALEGLDRGELRVAEKRAGEWVTNQWLKKAVLLSFRLTDTAMIPGAPGGASWWDKVPSKFAGMDAERFRAAGGDDE